MREPVWKRVYELHDKGLSQQQIAEKIGVSSVTVSYHLRTRGKPKRRAARSDAGTGRAPSACVDCGIPIHYNATRCRACNSARLSESASVRWAERGSTLFGWAEDNGRVPTTREAADLLGIGRSVAGELLLETFGRDDRDGYHRRIHPRPWPPR